MKEKNNERDGRADGAKQFRDTPRSEADLKAMRDRINRAIGHLNGICAMLDSGRSSGDILMQLASAKGALRALESMLMAEHVKTCSARDIKNGDTQKAVEDIMSILDYLRA